MIALDTSALMAILLNEPEADACIAADASEDDLLTSAGPMADALIVAARRTVGQEMGRLIDELDFEIVAVTPASARRIAQVYERWRKGVHRATLDFGDCFAYEIAKEHGCRLLYVGDGFAQTDVRGAL
jgi:ribonuclease VapC